MCRHVLKVHGCDNSCILQPAFERAHEGTGVVGCMTNGDSNKTKGEIATVFGVPMSHNCDVDVKGA